MYMYIYIPKAGLTCVSMSNNIETHLPSEAVRPTVSQWCFLPGLVPARFIVRLSLCLYMYIYIYIYTVPVY